MAYKRNKKNVSKRVTLVLIEIRQKVKIKQHLTLFSTVIQQRGAYIRGGEGGGPYNRMYFFCFQLDGPITGWAYKRGWGGGGGGGGLITRILQYGGRLKKSMYFTAQSAILPSSMKYVPPTLRLTSLIINIRALLVNSDSNCNKKNSKYHF